MSTKPVRCLITAGPTREFFDPVRYLSNPSSGKMGYALAQAAAEAGMEVTVVSGPTPGIAQPVGVMFIPVITGEEMYHAARERFAECDLFIATAAVMDYRPKAFSQRKIKKTGEGLTIELEPVVDILKTLAQAKKNQTVVGFAAETNDVEDYARRKMEEKNCDYIVANQVGGEASAFGRDDNTVSILSRSGEHWHYGPESKLEIARRIISLLTSVRGVH